ncbi:DUF6612 family protein [Paenactinomyces guangxiensis]|uniref:Lipoprotein n=1 Tax=Paenactinomyces guangxiensis TaxID=1490290 RepID=A0A7W1WP14_9BACL|nr:DUF6612 family protein [Paenactinomyces guangxiensis]MBA4493422.1 hypothetical protein [Paenactinomyces guangxiensis]MBH8590513.1 hypothetical protein [Paenactinomyces guangxiensis]
MNKRFFSIVALLAVFTLIFAGCNSKPAASPSDQPAKEEELSLVDVMTKSEEALSKAKGFSYKVEGTQKIGTPEASLTTDIDMKMDMTNNPQAMYAKGKVKAMGQEVPLEMYMVDNTIYQQVNGTWMEMKGAGLNQTGVNTEEPSAAVKKVKELVQKLGGTPKGFTMKKENGSYVVAMDGTAVKDSKEMLDALVEQIKGTLQGMDQAQQLNAKFDLNKIKVESYKETMYIDEKTFELKSVDHESKITMPVEGQSLMIDQKMKMSVEGAYDGKIEVPDEVKDKVLIRNYN